MIIDCHTHAYPAEVTADPSGWATEKNEGHWRDLVAPRDKPGIQGWSTPQMMLEHMDAANVSQSVLLGWYWENESTCRWHNEQIAEWLAFAPDRLYAFASILPNPNVLSQLEAAKELGFKGVGELHFGVQQFSSENRYWNELVEWCTAHDWPINLHATEAAGHSHSGSIPTPLPEFVKMATQAPDQKFILAHWGGGLAFFEQNPKLRKVLGNVFYDSAASPLLYDIQVVRRLHEIVGPEKLIFGSDYPLRIYPRKQTGPEMKQFIEEIRESSGLRDDDLSRFFYQNFAAIISGAH